MNEERKIEVEEVEAVPQPPRARVTESMERKRDYLTGFLAGDTEAPAAGDAEDVAVVLGDGGPSGRRRSAGQVQHGVGKRLRLGCGPGARRLVDELAGTTHGGGDDGDEDADEVEYVDPRHRARHPHERAARRRQSLQHAADQQEAQRAAECQVDLAHGIVPPGDHGAHGRFDAEAHPRSLQFWLDAHRGWVLGGVVAAAVAMSLRRGRRR